jgi:hypothetical protein
MPVPFEPKFVDMVRTLSTTTGTGPLVPGAPSPGFTTFALALAPGDRFYYCVQGIEKPLQREVGRGTLQANGTIAREPISGAAINFTAGNKTIALVTAAEWFRKIDSQGGSGGVAITGLASVASRTELAARPVIAGSQVALSEAGRSGAFVFDASTAMAERVAADPLQGVYVPPQSDISGASGAWVRQIDGPLNVRWFGARSDFVTNALPAFNAAHTLIKSGFAGTRSLLAEGMFYLAAAFNITTTMSIEGGGPGFDPTLRSIIRFAKNCDGIVVHHGQSSALVGLSGDGSGTRVAHLQLWGGNANVNASGTVTSYAAGDSLSGHGVRVRGAFVTIEDVQASFFGGDGFNVIANSGAGGETGGNANNFRLDNCQSIYNRGNGYTFAGVDANAGATYACSAISCGGGGFVDYSFLGNAHRDAHVRDCGVSDPTGSNGPIGSALFAGKRWYVVNGREALASTQAPGSVTNGTEAWREYGNGYAGKAWVPGLNWVNGAAFSTNPGNSNCYNCTFDNCYAESGQLPNQIYAPAMIVGGLLTENGHDKNATAPWLRAGAQSFTIPGITALESNGRLRNLTVNAANGAWNAVQPGPAPGSIHVPWSGDDLNGPAVTFGQGSGGAGGGIYATASNSYGTRMMLATSNNYEQGAKTALAIDELGNVDIVRAKLKLAGVPVKPAEWTPNFAADGVVYIPAAEAMTIGQGNGAIGTGTLVFTKSTAAAPGTFAATSLPATLEAGAWLKVAAAGVSGFVATHLKRVA